MADIYDLVDEFVGIKRQISELQNRASEIEAALIKHGESFLANTKYKSIRMRGSTDGIAVTATNAETLKLTYPSLLKEIFGKVYSDIVKEETSYTVNAHGKRLLLSVLTGSYNEGATLNGLFDDLNVDSATRKLLCKKIKGINFEKDKNNFMKICGFTEETASDYAYMATEAAAWENITKLLEISGGSNTPALFADLQTKIIQAAAADQTVKVSVLDLDL